MEITSFGDRVAAARKTAGLTQLQLAKKTGYSKNTICRLEKSHSAADVTQVTRIGDALKCDLAWLLTGEEGRKEKTRGAIPIFRASKVTDTSPSSSKAEGHLCYPGLDDCDFAVIIEGPAMSPRFSEGAIVAVRVGPIEDGQVAALFDEWGVFQVRWKRRVDGKGIYVAENSQYPPISEEKVKIIGRVIAGIQVNSY